MSRTVREPDPYFSDPKDPKACRDKKRWYKPPGWYKRMRRQERRSQDRNALRRILRDGEGEIPIHPHTDVWHWT
jgi:hypothetical protein